MCGRVVAYQDGTPDAFGPSISPDVAPGQEGAYVDGVSLTHGAEGSRQHVWTFVAAVYEGTSFTLSTCPCTNTDRTWPHEVPEFVGNDYFCDISNPGPAPSFTTFYADDPLWDGEGCGPTSTCCDDIEARICRDGGRDDENVIVSLLDIYVT